MALVWKKIRPGYTFHHPNGSAIQRTLTGPDGTTEVTLFGKGGGSTKMDGPFFQLEESAVATAKFMFENPTEAELELLKKANPTVVKDPAPEDSVVKTATIETTELEEAPQDKEVKGKGSPKKRGRPAKKKAPVKKD